MSEEDKEKTNHFTRMDIEDPDGKLTHSYYVCNSCKGYCFDLRGNQIVQNPKDHFAPFESIEVDYMFCEQCDLLENTKEKTMDTTPTKDPVSEEDMAAIQEMKKRVMKILPRKIAADYFSNL